MMDSVDPQRPRPFAGVPILLATLCGGLLQMTLVLVVTCPWAQLAVSLP
jgi:hypothetical protein